MGTYIVPLALAAETACVPYAAGIATSAPAGFASKSQWRET
jgi:hypothetical protein